MVRKQKLTQTITVWYTSHLLTAYNLQGEQN